MWVQAHVQLVELGEVGGLGVEVAGVEMKSRAKQARAPQRDPETRFRYGRPGIREIV